MKEGQSNNLKTLLLNLENGDEGIYNWESDFISGDYFVGHNDDFDAFAQVADESGTYKNPNTNIFKRKNLL